MDLAMQKASYAHGETVVFADAGLVARFSHVNCEDFVWRKQGDLGRVYVWLDVECG